MDDLRSVRIRSIFSMEQQYVVQMYVVVHMFLVVRHLQFDQCNGVDLGGRRIIKKRNKSQIIESLTHDSLYCSLRLRAMANSEDFAR